MKVIQINSVCGVGSTGRIALDIHNSLIEQGHESSIAYGREPARGCDEAIRIGSDLDVYIHGFYTRVFDKHGLASKKATEKLIRTIEEIQPDIVHLHNIHGYYLNYEIFFKFLKVSGLPVVWTLHDCWPFTGHCAYFTFVGCNRWQKGCYACPQKQNYPGSFFLDNSRENYERKKKAFTGIKNLTIVTPSQWLANLVKESFLREYEIAIVPNGIDTTVFRPEKSDFKEKYNIENKFIILGVASVWNKRKGLEHFVELAGMLQHDEVIVLVGLTQKQISRLPGNIIGISSTNNVQELVEIYSAADVFLNPTLEDNYPTVNLEAQACGTYTITFDSGGAKETILTPSHGTVCAEKTKAALRRVLNNFRENPPLNNLERYPLENGKQKLCSICREKFFQRVLETYNKKSLKCFPSTMRQTNLWSIQNKINK